MLLRVQARRFRCLAPACPRRTFAERLADTAPPTARRTERLADLQRHLGLAVGGELGARLAARLAMPVSADTLLRMAPRRGSLLDPYRDHLERRWSEGCHNAARLWQELVALGFPGRPTIVGAWATERRRAAPNRYRTPATAEGKPWRPPSGRRVARLLMADARALSSPDQTFAMRLLEEVPTLAATIDAAKRLEAVLCRRSDEMLADVLAAATSTQLAGFVAELRKDVGPPSTVGGGFQERRPGGDFRTPMRAARGGRCPAAPSPGPPGTRRHSGEATCAYRDRETARPKPNIAHRFRREAPISRNRLSRGAEAQVWSTRADGRTRAAGLP